MWLQLETKYRQYEFTISKLFDKKKRCEIINIKNFFNKQARSNAFFCKLRLNHITYREKVEELHRLEDEDVIEQIMTSDWGTTLVPVTKPNGRR